MALVIHARIRIKGPGDQLARARERVNLLLAREVEYAEVEERHSGSELVYDFKVRHGIPFPPFVAISREHPELLITAEWSDPQAGAEGSATIKEGFLVDQSTRPLTGAAANLSLGPEYVAVTASGELLLALTFMQIGSAEFAGYAVTSTQDAMFKIVRSGATTELSVTAGSEPAWGERWLIDFSQQSSEYREIDPAEPIPESLYQDLERMAREFVEHWIWFASSPLSEIVIEKQRYEAAGYPVREASVRMAKLRNLPKRAAAEGEMFEFSSLAPDTGWLKEVIEHCWARE